MPVDVRWIGAWKGNQQVIARLLPVERRFVLKLEEHSQDDVGRAFVPLSASGPLSSCMRSAPVGDCPVERRERRSMARLDGGQSEGEGMRGGSWGEEDGAL